MSLFQVWTHLDNGSCPGQAVGVRVRHDNSISGFIPTKMISDKHIKSPQERVKVQANIFIPSPSRIHIIFILCAVLYRSMLMPCRAILLCSDFSP